MFQMQSYTDTPSTVVRHIPPPHPQPPPQPAHPHTHPHPHKAASYRVYYIYIVKLQVLVGCSDILHVCDDKGSTYQNMSLVNNHRRIVFEMVMIFT